MSKANLISPDAIGADQKQNRTEVKKVRLTPTESKNLDAFLKDIDTSFSAFVRDAISLRQSVKKATEKSRIAVAPPPKIDPELLLEIGRIGTNVNQISKSLNIIKNNENSSLAINFSFIECLQVLKQMQVDLHAVVGELPKIKRSEAAVNNAKKRAVAKMLEGQCQQVGDDVL